MAFQWNWLQPPTINNDMTQWQRVATDNPGAYMQGYAPWLEKQIPGLGVGRVTPEYLTDEQIQSQNAQAQLEALRSEYVANERRIQELKMQIVKIQQDSAKSMDDLDMRLAANRAGVGDIGNAVAHQNRIITRQQLANASNSTSAEDKAALDLVSSFIDTESAMMMGDNSQRPGFQNKLDFLQYQIDKNPKAKQLLEKFRGSTGGAPVEQSKTFQDFNNFVSDKRTGNASNPTKKNGLTKADKEAIDEYWYSLPKEVREANKEAYNAIRGEEDIESLAAKGKKLAALQLAAVNEAAANLDTVTLADKGSYTHNATNGQNVSVTRSKYNNDGTMDIIITCGKQKKVVTK